MKIIRDPGGCTFVGRVLCVCVLALAAYEGTRGAAAAEQRTPDLSGVYYRGLYMKPPAGVQQDVVLPLGGIIPGMFGPGPIRQMSGLTDPAKQYALGDDRAPILKSRAIAAVKAHNDAIAAGRLAPPGNQPCQPSGLFMQLTNPGAMKVTQTANEITLEFQSDGDKRVIYLNGTHPAAVVPSMNGHSIGRWEGDTLVVDTVGIEEKSSLDRYGTPHSTMLHVVERIRRLSNGAALENHLYAEDQVNFFAPWWGVVTYRRSDEPWNVGACRRP
jgi:hypothetical protein